MKIVLPSAFTRAWVPSLAALKHHLSGMACRAVIVIGVSVKPDCLHL